MTVSDFPDDNRERLLAMSGPRIWEEPGTVDADPDGYSWSHDPAEYARLSARLVELQDCAE